MAANTAKPRIETRAEAELRPVVPMLGRDEDAREARWPSLVERLEDQLRPLGDDELERARIPHPHAFQDGEHGFAPVGEVTVLAAPGREGKTHATVAIAVAYVLGLRLGGLTPSSQGSVVIYSAEDDRQQYARKIEATRCNLGAEDRERVRQRVLVPDLSVRGMEPFATLVRMIERRPVEAESVVDAVIDVLRARMDGPAPPRILFFETASTLSEAEEDNTSFRVMVRVLRRIARELHVACVLVHHTSQAASNNLPELNVSVSDIRGGTALAFNARQCFLLVNLGSEHEPYPENDARTVLREMVAPDSSGQRVTALLCLDSSKAMDPEPIFFRWHGTDAGPALSLLPLPRELEGIHWRKLHQLIRGERAERRQEAKSQARNGTVQQVRDLVGQLARDGRPATTNAVSGLAGRSPTWAKSYLEQAVEHGVLRCRLERVPRTRGQVPVYSLTDSTEGER